MADRRRASHRGYAPALLSGLAGAVAVTVGVTRPWATATGTMPGLPVIHAEADGSTLAPLAGAFGVVLLAAFGAVIATRGWVRRGLGGLIVVVAIVVVIAAIHPGGAHDALADGLSAKGWAGGPFHTGVAWWRWLTLAGGLVAMVAGAAIARYGGGWATMGSRYDSPAGKSDASRSSASSQDSGEAEDEAAMWKAIDQGRDPTHRP